MPLPYSLFTTNYSLKRAKPIEAATSLNGAGRTRGKKYK